jgi:hypothetical protein
MLWNPAGMRWLSEPSSAAVTQALRAVVPELSGLPIDIPGLSGQDDPVWQMSSAALGEDFFVKFAWSQAAARFVLHQISVLETLGHEPAVPFLPEVVASSTDPLILVTRRVRGPSLFEVVDSIDTDHAGMQIARFLAALHGDKARRGGSRRGSRVVSAGHHQRAAGAVRPVGEGGAAAEGRGVVRLGRRDSGGTAPDGARARRSARRQPGLGRRRAQGGPRLRERRHGRAGVRAARLPGTRHGPRGSGLPISPPASAASVVNSPDCRYLPAPARAASGGVPR